MSRLRSRIVSSLLLLAPLASTAPAVTFSATAGTASYANSVLGSTLSNTFSFTGPSLSVTGSGATPFTIDTLQTLGVPFGFSVALVIDDFGTQSGPAMAGGMNFPDVQYLGPASITALAPITLGLGNLTVSVPAQVTGTITACSPFNICAFGGGIPSDVFDISFTVPGTLTVTYALFNIGPQYSLTSARFASNVPEPATWLLSLGALALVAVRVMRLKAARVV
jgi:hypothetical protein